MSLREVMRPGTVTGEMRSLSKPVKLMSLLFLVYVLGWGMANPFLPLYFNDILGNFVAVGLVMGLLPLFSVVWALLFGGFIDRIPKRTVIITMLVLYLPLSYFLLSLKTLSHFVYFRIYHAFNATGLWVSSDAYVRKHSQKGKEAEAIALWDVGAGIATIIGAASGGLLLKHLGFSYLWVISLFAAIALVISLFLPDHEKTKTIKIRWDFLLKELKDFFAHRRLVIISVFDFFYIFAVSFVMMILPLFLLEIGASFIEIGLITALFFTPLLAEPYFSTFERKDLVVLVSTLCASALFLAMFYLQNVLAVFAASTILGLFLAAIKPITGGHKTKLMPKKEIGELSAIIFAIKGLAGGVGPIVAGVIAQWLGLRYVFLLGFVIFLGLSAMSKRIGF